MITPKHETISQRPPVVDSDYNLEDVLGTYRLDGSMSCAKARVLVEVWLDCAYARLIDPEITNAHFIALGEKLIELADLRPKKEQQSQNDAKLSVTINLSGAQVASHVTIDAVPEDTILGVPPLVLPADTNGDLIGCISSGHGA